MSPLLVTLIPGFNFLAFTVFSRCVLLSRLVLATVLLRGSALLATLVQLWLFAAGLSALTSMGAWACANLFEIRWAFLLDYLAYVIFAVVFSVSAVVHAYSTEYRQDDPHLARFISYLSLFTFFIFLLITGDNFVGLFLGWEGVGLCSYLLISFWFTRLQANKAAIKARVVNRVADLTFTVGVLTAFYVFQAVTFAIIFGATTYGFVLAFNFFSLCTAALSLITTLLFLGARGKSAQIGLHTWLPDAREGPTPVSALIHAATRVTAGVFLLIRSSYLFLFVPAVSVFVSYVGAATAFRAATAGLLQNDLKKVIAYSTCSQLGYIVLSCGVYEYALGFFHLSNHAFFKALLFLSAGSVIHSRVSEQDLRRLGGLAQLLPYAYGRFVVGSLALRGFPFLTGFYSKDIIIEVAAGAFGFAEFFGYVLGLVTAFFTAFYSFRLLNFAFYGAARGLRTYLYNTHELTSRRAYSLGFLALGSIFLGYTARDLFVGFGTAFWSGVILSVPARVNAQISGEFLPMLQKLTPTFGSAASVLMVFVVYNSLRNETATLYLRPPVLSAHRFLSRKWYFDAVYNRIVNQPLLEVSYTHFFSAIDKGVLELVGPLGLARLSFRFGAFVARFQTGRVFDQSWFRFVGMCFIFLLFSCV